MVQAAICKYIILPDTDRKKGDLQYPHPNVVHRAKSSNDDSSARKFPRPKPDTSQGSQRKTGADSGGSAPVLVVSG